AIPDRIDLALAGDFFYDVKRGERTLAHVIFEAFLGELGVRVDPGDGEYREALVDAPFDEGFFRRQIEYVELVDPGRPDQQWAHQHRWRRRRVLNELHQLIFENDLARREREIAADLEHFGPGLTDLEVAPPGRDVLGEHVHATHKIARVRGERFAQELGIGEYEIGRRDRVGDLADIELCFLPGVRIERLGVAHQPVRPLHRQEIGLLEEIEELIGRPLGIGKALVLRIGRGDR